MTSRIVARSAVAVAASLAAIAPLAGCASDAPSTSTSRPSTTSDANSSSPSPSLSPSVESSGSEYVDGTYTARGVYGGAPSYMDFTVTLEDGLITDVKSELMPDNNDTSRGYQERFAAAVPDEVIGKSIDDLEVGVIAGASGCADGFNDALTKIREQASANQ